MEREDIERTDFPVTRRGYDTASVDAHLRRVAEQFPTAPAGSLAAGTSEQVRVILEAAEQSAAQLRSDAERAAGGHVERVREAAAGMVTRLDELQKELDSLLDGLRKSAERLSEGLAALHERAGDLELGEAPPAEPELPEPQPEPEKEGDEAGARIIALNMALGGTSRDETAAYLAEHFALADPDSLLDDVYAKVGR